MKIPRTLLVGSAFMVVALAQATLTLAADFSAIWDGSNGNWSDFTHWSSNPNYPNNSGGITYDATINSGAVSLDRNITIQRLFMLNNGDLAGSAFSLTLNEGITAMSDKLQMGVLNLASGSSSTMRNVGLYGTLNNAGTVDNYVMVLNGSAAINNAAGATYKIEWGLNPLNGMLTPPEAGQFNNFGNLIVDADASFSRTSYMRTVFNNFGDVSVIGTSDFYVSQGSTFNGTFTLAAQTGVRFQNYTIGYGTTISGGTATVDHTLNVAGYVTINSDLVNRGTLSVQQGATLNLNGSFRQVSGSVATYLDHATLTSSQVLNFEAGKLMGSGTITEMLASARIKGARLFQLR